jgi:hypothetical protein
LYNQWAERLLFHGDHKLIRPRGANLRAGRPPWLLSTTRLDLLIEKKNSCQLQRPHMEKKAETGESPRGQRRLPPSLPALLPFRARTEQTAVAADLRGLPVPCVPILVSAAVASLTLTPAASCHRPPCPCYICRNQHHRPTHIRGKGIITRNSKKQQAHGRGSEVVVVAAGRS